MAALPRRSTFAAAMAVLISTPARAETRRLGKNGIKVSGVGLGTNNFGARMDYAATERVVHAAVDMGITLFDTADVYTQGVSEEFLGRALGPRRKNVVIATKFGNKMRKGKYPDGGGWRQAVIDMTEDSLRRLGTDVIDLQQYHRPDGKTPIEETLDALNDLIKQGKIRAIGSSNLTGPEATAAHQAALAAKLTPYVTAQNHYSLLTRDIEKDLVPVCEQYGIGVLPYFPLESGMLTGKYKRDEKPAEGTRLSAWAPRTANTTETFMSDANFTKVEKLTALANQSGATILNMAFGWLLNRPYIASVIAGATAAEQIAANVKAGEWRPTLDLDAEIDRITRAA